MSEKKKKKLEQQQAAAQDSAKQKVLMRFKEHKYYNDLNNPIFDAGKVYELSGAAWIERWIKRGGEIVTEEQLAAEGQKKLANVESSEMPTESLVSLDQPKTEEPKEDSEEN